MVTLYLFLKSLRAHPYRIEAHIIIKDCLNLQNSGAGCMYPGLSNCECNLDHFIHCDPLTCSPARVLHKKNHECNNSYSFLSVKIVGEAEVVIEGLRIDVALADLEFDAGVVVHVVDAHLLAEAVPMEEPDSVLFESRINSKFTIP